MTWIDNKTVLFIGGSDNTSANTLCVMNLAAEMITRGYHVTVLAAGDKYVKEAGFVNGVEIWQVPESYFTSLGRYASLHPSFLSRLVLRVVGLLRHILLLPFYPITSLVRTRRVLKKTKELVVQKDIRLIVATYHSYENIYAGLRIKKELGHQIKLVTYHLDLRTVTVNNSVIVRRFVKKHAGLSVVRESRIVDSMLIPYSGKKEILQLKGLEQDKVHFVGFPVFITPQVAKSFDLPFKKDVINISYIGTLSLNNRNPKNVLNLLEQISNYIDKKIEVHVWGHVGEVVEVLNSSPIAYYHGSVDNCYARYILDHSDFLLNIGNALSYNMLPSKVFSLFATGKPIVNVITHPKDATIPYFEVYSHSIDINEFNSSPIEIQELSDEMIKLINAPLRRIDHLFDGFKPETICDIIMQ